MSNPSMEGLVEMANEQELIDLAKEHLTEYVNECGCTSQEDVFQAIRVMLVVAASVKEAQLNETEGE